MGIATEMSAHDDMWGDEEDEDDLIALVEQSEVNINANNDSSSKQKEKATENPREVWTLQAEWGYGADGFHSYSEPEKWMVGTFSSRVKAISNVDMVMEKITGMGKEWKDTFEVDDNRKKVEGIILSAYADDTVLATLSACTRLSLMLFRKVPSLIVRRLRTTTTMMRAMKSTDDNNITVKFVSSVVYFE